MPPSQPLEGPEMEGNEENEDSAMSCDGCNMKFHSRGPLDIHKLICTKPLNKNKTQGTSFLGSWKDCKGQETQNETVKNNNSSQKASAQNITCPLCQRTFGTLSGLKRHTKSCVKKNSAHNVASEVEPNSSRNMTIEQPTIISTENRSSQEARTVWGNHSPQDLTQIVNSIYEEIVFWRKNLFKLPSGSAGKRYITEVTHLIDCWTESEITRNKGDLGRVNILLWNRLIENNFV